MTEYRLDEEGLREIEMEKRTIRVLEEARIALEKTDKVLAQLSAEAAEEAKLPPHIDFGHVQRLAQHPHTVTLSGADFEHVRKVYRAVDVLSKGSVDTEIRRLARDLMAETPDAVVAVLNRE